MIDNRIIMCGGLIQQRHEKHPTATPTVFTLDPARHHHSSSSTLRWEPVAPMNHARHGAVGCVAMAPAYTTDDDKTSTTSDVTAGDTSAWRHRMYMFGGMDENKTILTSIECYDCHNNTWTLLSTSMPRARAGHQCVYIHDEIEQHTGIWLLGGQSMDGSACTIIDIYHPHTNTWSHPRYWHHIPYGEAHFTCLYLTHERVIVMITNRTGGAATTAAGTQSSAAAHHYIIEPFTNPDAATGTSSSDGVADSPAVADIVDASVRVAPLLALPLLPDRMQGGTIVGTSISHYNHRH